MWRWRDGVMVMCVTVMVRWLNSVPKCSGRRLVSSSQCNSLPSTHPLNDWVTFVLEVLKQTLCVFRSHFHLLRYTFSVGVEGLPSGHAIKPIATRRPPVFEQLLLYSG